MNFYKIFLIGLFIIHLTQANYRKARIRHGHRIKKFARKNKERGPTKFKMEIKPQADAENDNYKVQDFKDIVNEANQAVNAAKALKSVSGTDALTERHNNEDFKGKYEPNHVKSCGHSDEDEVVLKNKSDLKSTLVHTLPLLEKISMEIQKENDEEKKLHNSRNDFPCSIDGKWVSNVGGVKLQMTTISDGRVTVLVSATDSPHEGDLESCAWHLSGLVPSHREGPFALAAVCSQQHRIATFVGQCKVCEDSETIFGTWMFSWISRDCSDVMSAVEIKPDVWRKDHMSELKKEKEKKLHKTTHKPPISDILKEESRK